jgi:hypothetical protein
MDMKSRNQYLQSLIEKRGYLLQSKKEKGQLLDEFCANTDLNRKWAIAKIRTGQYLQSGKKQTRKNRQPKYTNETIQELKRLWRIFDHSCGQNLAPTLAREVDRLIEMGELKCSPEAAIQLKTISARTIDEKLKPIKENEGLKHKYQKKIHPLLYQQIPIKVFSEQDRDALGNIQADLVEHCGQSASGPFISTISATDIYSGWWQGRSVANLSQQAVQVGLAGLRKECPFVWQSFHSDNDRSFINKFFYGYCREEKLPFSRSRPYKKNDNCLVEEKNKTHIRWQVGYRRYDTLKELEILNEIWEKVADFKNFFQSSMKLVKKERIKSRIKRKYGKPLTPYQRIMEYDMLSEETKRELQDYYGSLNPVRLKREIEKLQTALYEAYEKKQEKSKGRSVRFLIAEQGAVSVR